MSGSNPGIGVPPSPGHAIRSGGASWLASSWELVSSSRVGSSGKVSSKGHKKSEATAGDASAEAKDACIVAPALQAFLRHSVPL